MLFSSEFVMKISSWIIVATNLVIVATTFYCYAAALFWLIVVTNVKGFFRSPSLFLLQKMFKCCNNFSSIFLLFCYEKCGFITTIIASTLVFLAAFPPLFYSFNFGSCKTTNLVKTP